MLLYNLSSKLINGTRGTIEALEDDGPTVNFEDVGLTMKLQRCTWFAYKVGTADNIIGQRSINFLSDLHGELLHIRCKGRQ